MFVVRVEWLSFLVGGRAEDLLLLYWLCVGMSSPARVVVVVAMTSRSIERLNGRIKSMAGESRSERSKGMRIDGGESTGDCLGE